MSYLSDKIIDLQESGMCKFRLTKAIQFISSKDLDKECVMHLKSNNTEFIIYNNASDNVDETFWSLILR